jgi:hypothetical protein
MFLPLGMFLVHWGLGAGVSGWEVAGAGFAGAAFLRRFGAGLGAGSASSTTIFFTSVGAA